MTALRVPERDMAGLRERLPPGRRVGVEAEQREGLGWNLAEGEGDKQGAAGAEGSGL